MKIANLAFLAFSCFAPTGALAKDSPSLFAVRAHLDAVKANDFQTAGQYFVPIIIVLLDGRNPDRKEYSKELYTMNLSAEARVMGDLKSYRCTDFGKDGVRCRVVYAGTPDQASITACKSYFINGGLIEKISFSMVKTCR